MSLKAAIRRFLLSSPTRSKITLGIGLGLTGFFVFLVFFDFLVRPYSPQLIFDNAAQSPPSVAHPFGTDALGRDILSRIFAGAKYSISIAFLAVAESLAVGTVLGAIAGYFNGKLDRILLLFVDALYSFPAFILALLISIMLGAGVVNTATAIAIPLSTQFFRIIRSITLEVKERTFIEAEIELGASSSYILTRHIAPSFVPSLLVMSSLTGARAILTVASLGFLGLGLPPPTPEWGTDMSLARIYIPTGIWWSTFFPGLFIFLAVIGFTLLSEGLAEVLRTQEKMEKLA